MVQMTMGLIPTTPRCKLFKNVQQNQVANVVVPSAVVLFAARRGGGRAGGSTQGSNFRPRDVTTSNVSNEGFIDVIMRKLNTEEGFDYSTEKSTTSNVSNEGFIDSIMRKVNTQEGFDFPT